MRSLSILLSIAIAGCYSAEGYPTQQPQQDDFQNPFTEDGSEDDTEDSADSPPDDSSDDNSSDDNGSPDPDPETDAATLVGASFPQHMQCGETASVSIGIRNVGNTTWTREGGYKLGTVDDSDPFYGPSTRVWLEEGDVVEPGDIWVFEFELVAPEETGSLVSDWQMVHESVHWFGESMTAVIEVECSDPFWNVLACARNGAEICDDEAFTVPTDGTVMGILCDQATNGTSFISANTGPAQNDGVHRCQGWEDQGLNAWDYLDYIDSFECNTVGEVLVIDLSPWAGEGLWFGSHDNPGGGGSMTNTCLVELVE